MFKLTAKNDWQNAKWYFYTMEECELFKCTLRDHGADINWNDIVTVPNSTQIGSTYRGSMNKDPRQRAIEALGWAFNSYIPDNPASNKSMQMTRDIMKHISE